MRLLKVKSWVRLRRRRCCPVWRALKWFWPGLRATSFPFLVTLMRLLNDLFVFIYNLSSRSRSVATIAYSGLAVKAFLGFRSCQPQVNRPGSFSWFWWPFRQSFSL